VLAVRRNAPGAPRYGPVKLGLRHAVSAYRGGPWEPWGRAGAAQGSIIASGALRGSRRYRDDAQLHVDELSVLVAMSQTSSWPRTISPAHGRGSWGHRRDTPKMTSIACEKWPSKHRRGGVRGRPAADLQHDDDAARTAPPNFAQPNILSYGTCVSAKILAIRPARGCCTSPQLNQRTPFTLVLDPPYSECRLADFGVTSCLIFKSPWL